MLILGIFLHQERKQFGLCLSEFMVNLCVAVDFYCYIALGFVIEGWNYLSETAFAEDFVHFKSIQDVITDVDIVVAILVIPLCTWGSWVKINLLDTF